LWSGLILGAIWGVWHLPAFLLSGTPQSSWSFAPYFIAVVAISVILTPMFNAARGSILIAAMFHFQMNGPAWPDAQPWDTLVFSLAAFLIVLLNRKTIVTRDSGVTEVLLPTGVVEPQPTGLSRHTSSDKSQPSPRRWPRDFSPARRRDQPQPPQHLNSVSPNQQQK
jgi:hypothetical protein